MEMAEDGSRYNESVSAKDPSQSTSACRYTPGHLANISEETLRVMDLLGYGPHIRQARRDAYREVDSLRTARDRRYGFTNITTGSKGEGITCCFESDTDIMRVIDHVICVEDGVNCDNISRESTLMILNTRCCYHGHCKLLLGRRNQFIHPYVRHALCNNDYLSSELFPHVCPPGIIRLELGEERHPREGPSMPSTLAGVVHQDTVFSLRCHCPRILQKWASRVRHWPPPDVVQKVESLGAYVTPVGFKGSENKNLEWRICFNTGEIELISSLNDVQTKLYIILKMIVKDVLNPQKKEITSYTLKNIVLWLAENNHQSEFHERSLFYWLHKSLISLKAAIDTLQLEYYMIPERNLMAGCEISDEQRQTWLTTIADMIDDGPRVLLRLPKIRRAIIAHPEPLLWFNKMRTIHKMLMLTSLIRVAQCESAGVEPASDSLYQMMLKCNFIIPMQVCQRMIIDGSRVDGLFNLRLRMLM